MEWYTTVMQKYADFSGRARRKEYWMYALFNILILVGLLIVDSVVTVKAIGFPVFYFLYAIGSFLPGLAVTIRRLHDTGKSGWFFFIALIPFIGPLILLVFMIQEGEQGRNDYGPDPKSGSGRGESRRKRRYDDYEDEDDDRPSKKRRSRDRDDEDD